MFLFQQLGSWGLSLFVLFEHHKYITGNVWSSWGLSLFVLFEPNWYDMNVRYSSWGLSLFVLFEHLALNWVASMVLEG